jgi:hypothetical protein
MFEEPLPNKLVVNALKAATGEATEEEALSSLLFNCPSSSVPQVYKDLPPYKADLEKGQVFKEDCARELALQKPFSFEPSDIVITRVHKPKEVNEKLFVRASESFLGLPFGWRPLERTKTFQGLVYNPEVQDLYAGEYFEKGMGYLVRREIRKKLVLRPQVRVWNAAEFVAMTYSLLAANKEKTLVFSDTPVLHDSGIITVTAAFYSVDHLDFAEDYMHPQWLKDLLNTDEFKVRNYARNLGPTHKKASTRLPAKEEKGY